MLPYYLILGVDENATDETIRKRYLELVRRYTPEKHPERFRKINEAYEAIKARQDRVAGKLFDIIRRSHFDTAVRLLADSREIRKRRVGLRELFRVAGTGGAS